MKEIYYVLLCILLLKAEDTLMHQMDIITIQKVKQGQVPSIKKMIIEAAIELQNLSESYEKLEHYYDSYGEFDDLKKIDETYLNNDGLFLVLLDDNKIVGTGGIKKITEEICELKRMWFCSSYRGKGLGSQILSILLNFAKNKRYKKVRLNLYFPEYQAVAIYLYKKFGFYEIAPYNDTPAKIFMEKELE